MAEVARKSRRGGSKPGERRGGRKKGTPNKLTSTFREAVLVAYEGIGGHEAFKLWAKNTQTEFYKIAARLIPTEIQQLGKDGKPVDPSVAAQPVIHMTVGALPEPKKGNGHG
jgi:hypothetical protein